MPKVLLSPLFRSRGTRRGIFARIARDDRGSTMAAVMMVTLVVSALGVSSVQVARHSNDATSVDRERFQSVGAAEAGVNEAISRLQAGWGCDATALPAVELNDQGATVGSFRTRIDPEAGTACGETQSRVIHSWGFAPTGSGRAMRQVEVGVKLVPYDGFRFTLFASGSSGTVIVKNTGSVDGDVYALNLDQTKNNITADTVISAGSIDTKDNAVYTGTVWSGGNVHLGENARVGQSVIASGTKSGSQGDITLDNNDEIGGDVRAKGAVNLPTNYAVNGSIAQGDLYVPPAPVLQLPTFAWNATDYLPVVPTEGTATEITAALQAMKDNLQGVFHSNGPGIVSLPTNATVTGPLTIVSSDSVELGRTMSVSGGPYPVVIVAESTGPAAISAPQPFTAASGLHVLYFTNGTIELKSQVSMTGSVYANVIDIKNALNITRSDVLSELRPPGFTFTPASAARFTVVPTIWREIVPGLPPA